MSPSGWRRRTTSLRRNHKLLPRGQRSAARSCGTVWREYDTSSRGSSTRQNSRRTCASARSSTSRMKMRCSTPRSTPCASAKLVRGRRARLKSQISDQHLQIYRDMRKRWHVRIRTIRTCHTTGVQKCCSFQQCTHPAKPSAYILRSQCDAQ